MIGLSSCAATKAPQASDVDALAQAIANGVQYEVGVNYGLCVYMLVAYTDSMPYVYVGSSKDITRRLHQHKNPSTMTTLVKKFLQYHRLLSFDDFTCYILKSNLLITSVAYWERFYITKLNTLHPNGLNHWLAKGVPSQNRYNYAFFKQKNSIKKIRKTMF